MVRDVFRVCIQEMNASWLRQRGSAFSDSELWRLLELELELEYM